MASRANTKYPINSQVTAMWWPNRSRHCMGCVPTLQLEVHLGTPIPAVHLEHCLSPWPCLAVLGHCPSHYLCSVCPLLGMVGQGFWGRSLPQSVPCQSTLSPDRARGSPLITKFAVPPQVLNGSQSVTKCQRRTLMGSASCGSSMPAQSEGGYLLWGLPSQNGSTCMPKVQGWHGANTPGHTGQCNWRNVPFLKSI